MEYAPILKIFKKLKSGEHFLACFMRPALLLKARQRHYKKWKLQAEKDAEKSFEKIQNSFMIKIFNILDMENDLNITTKSPLTSYSVVKN